MKSIITIIIMSIFVISCVSGSSIIWSEGVTHEGEFVENYYGNNVTLFNHTRTDFETKENAENPDLMAYLDHSGVDGWGSSPYGHVFNMSNAEHATGRHLLSLACRVAYNEENSFAYKLERSSYLPESHFAFTDYSQTWQAAYEEECGVEVGTDYLYRTLNLSDYTLDNNQINGYKIYKSMLKDSYNVYCEEQLKYNQTDYCYTYFDVVKTKAINDYARFTLLYWDDLWGDLNRNGNCGDSVDKIMMDRASVGDWTPDWRFDLNGNGNWADSADVQLMNTLNLGNIDSNPQISYNISA